MNAKWAWWPISNYSLWRWQGLPQNKSGIGPPHVCTCVHTYLLLYALTNVKTCVPTYTHAYHKHIQAQRKGPCDHMISVILYHNSNFHVCLVPSENEKRASDPTELELLVVVSCQVCAGNWTHVLYKSSPLVLPSLTCRAISPSPHAQHRDWTLVPMVARQAIYWLNHTPACGVPQYRYSLTYDGLGSP